MLDIISKSTYNHVHMEINTEKTLQKYSSLYYTRQNLSLILGRNRRTLDSRIATLIKNKIILPLKSGFYLNLVLFEKSTIATTLLEYVGSILVTPSYLSLEYMLSVYGFLAEDVTTLTYVTTKKTRLFETSLSRFSYRTIHPALFTNFKIAKYDKYSYYLASFAKAIFDLIYFTPFKNKREMTMFLVESRFNWDRLALSDKKELTLLLTTTPSLKLSMASSILKNKGFI